MFQGCWGGENRTQDNSQGPPKISCLTIPAAAAISPPVMQMISSSIFPLPALTRIERQEWHALCAKSALGYAKTVAGTINRRDPQTGEGMDE